MKKENLKKFFIIFILIVFLFQTTYVFALEIKYPSVPGALTPQEIEQKIKDKEIEKEDRLPLYFKYYFNLSLIVVVLICLGVLIFGATLYLLSPAKPVVLVSARRWIFSGLLGLLILFSSYLVLVTINPQLALLKLPKERVDLGRKVAPLTREGTTYFEVPTGRLIEENLSHITATTTRIIAGISHWPDCDDDRTDCWGGDKGPRDTIKYCTSDDFSFAWCQPRDSADGCKNNEVIVAITWPKCEGGQMDCWGGQAKIKCCGPVKLIGCYTTNTPSCKDGEVLHRITHWPDCLWDLSVYQSACWDEQRDKVRCCTPEKVQFSGCYELQSPEVEGPEINKFVSELEKVKARSEDLKRNMELFEEATEACSCGTSNCKAPPSEFRLDRMICRCEPKDDQCEVVCDKDLIAERMEAVKEAVGKLEAERVRLVTLQVPILIDYLEMKKAGLLMTLPEDEIDYGEFALIKYLSEREGERITTESFDAWPSPVITKEIAGGKVILPDPATFYFYPDRWENQQALAETERLNPILILSNTPPAELNKQIAERVGEILGDNVFNLLSDSDWEEIVRESLEEGTFKALEGFVIALTDAVSRISAGTLAEKLTEKAKEQTSMILEKLALIASAQTQTSDPLTEKLAEFLTTRLEEILPSLLRDALSKDILDFIDEITGGDIKNIFYADFYELLNQQVKDLLSSQITDLSPILSRVLTIRVIEVLPFTIVADFLTSINDFLTEQIEKIKSIITREIQIIVDKVVAVITQVLLDNLPSWLETIILAFMEGIELVIAEIVKGYVEAYIMYYLDGFLKDVYKFQEKLDDLLTLTLKDILPKEVKNFLEKDIENLLPKDVRDFLHKDFIEFLPEKTRDFLTKSLKEFLPEEIRDILDESLASLLGIEFIFEKTLYDFFPARLKEVFEKGFADIFPGILKEALRNLLPDEAFKSFVELSESQRRFLFYTSVLDLLPEQLHLQDTPLEILEIADARVMDLLDPSVALLVRIIEDYLRPDERPEPVNELIRILKKSLTAFIRDDLANPELAEILNTPLYYYLPQNVKDELNKSFVEHFPELSEYVLAPVDKSLIDVIDEHAGSAISQILSQSIFSFLPPEIRDRLNIRLKDFLPDWIVNKKLYELLPESWLGSIADFLGLTDQDIEEAIEETMEEIDLDTEINAIIQTISDEMASAFTNALINNLAERTGQKISEEKADELTEKISEYMNTLVEKAWNKVMSEGFMLDTLKNI